MKCNLCEDEAVYTFASGDSLCKKCVSKLVDPKAEIIKLQNELAAANQKILEQQAEIERKVNQLAPLRVPIECRVRSE